MNAFAGISSRDSIGLFAATAFTLFAILVAYEFVYAGKHRTAVID